MTNAISLGTYVPFGTPVNVSTLTEILPWTFFGSVPKALLFAVRNLDAAQTVFLLVETSEGASYIDEANSFLLEIAPETQNSFEVGPYSLRSHFRISAYTTSPAFPVVQIQWMLRTAAT